MKITRKSLLTSLLLIIFIDSLSYFIVIPVLLRLMEPGRNNFFSAGLSSELRNTAFGLTIGLLSLAYLLFAPVMGRYSDQLGRKIVLNLCLVITAISFGIAILAINLHSFILLLIGRFLSGVGASSQPIAWAAITDLSVQKRKAQYLSLAALAMTLAMMLGPLLGAYLSDFNIISFFNNQTPFLVALSLIAVNILLLNYSFQETSQQKQLVKEGLWRQGWQSLINVVKDRRVRIILFVFLCYEFTWSLYFQAIPLYLKLTKEYTTEQCSHFITWIGIWMLFSLTVIYPFIIRYCSLNSIIKSSLVIMAIALTSSVINQSSIIQWASAIPLAMTVGVIYPSLLALMSNRVQAYEQGWIMGLAASMLSLAWMLSAFITGPLTNFSSILPIKVAALGAGVILLIFIVWSWIIDRK